MFVVKDLEVVNVVFRAIGEENEIVSQLDLCFFYRCFSLRNLELNFVSLVDQLVHLGFAYFFVLFLKRPHSGNVLDGIVILLNQPFMSKL